MAKKSYVGISGKSKNIPNKGYVGVSNKSKKLLKGYVGDNQNKARLFWDANIDTLVYVIFDQSFTPSLTKFRLDGTRVTGTRIDSRIDVGNDFENLRKDNPFKLGYVTDGYQTTNNLIKGPGGQNIWAHENDNTEWIIKDNAINKEVTGASANSVNKFFIPTNRIYFKKTGSGLANDFALSLRFNCKGTSSVAGTPPKLTVSFAYQNDTGGISQFGGTDIEISSEYSTYSQAFSFRSFNSDLFFDFLVISSDNGASGDFTIDIKKIEVIDFEFKNCVMYDDQDTRTYKGIRFPLQFGKLTDPVQLSFFDLTCNIQKTSGQDDIYVCYTLDEIFSYYPDQYEYPVLFGRYEVVFYFISDSAFTLQKTLTDPSSLKWWESGPGYGTYTYNGKTINVATYDLEVSKWVYTDVFTMNPPKITPNIPPLVAKDIIMSYRTYSVHQAFCLGSIRE